MTTAELNSWCEGCAYLTNGVLEFPCNRCKMPEEGSADKLPTFYRLKRESTPQIKDSGERREFPSGAVRDVQYGKGRCDLLPLSTVAELITYSESHSESTSFNFDVLEYLDMFTDSGVVDMSCRNFLYDALIHFADKNQWDIPTMVLEVSKHFEAGAAKYGERNWQKGIPLHCYIDSAVRHYLKWCRGDTDEPHDRAFCWNLLCCVWTLTNKPECNDLIGDADGNG